jgi:erythromycin esterase
MLTACRRAVLLVVGLIGCGSDDSERNQYPTTPPPGGNGGGASQIAGFPAGWFGGTANPEYYEVGRDAAVLHGGGASAYLRSRSSGAKPANAFIALTQLLRADAYRGKRVRLSGYLRTNDAVGAEPVDGGALWLRADAPRRTAAFDNMFGRQRTGTQDWGLAEIVLDIPNDVIGLAFGALFAGPGIVWVDDLKLEIVSTDVPVTAPPSTSTSGADSATLAANYERASLEPVNMDFEGVILPENQAATVDWVKTHSVPFTTDDPNANDSDLQPLQQMIGSARLVALGESTHGTREFFRMKHRVFSWLVRNMGFTHFGIEASLPEALAVDRYVQTGIGDPAALVRGMGFWTWSTEEVIALVRWMRQWNESGGQPRVYFTGFDMQAPGVAMDSVQAFTTEMNPASGDSVRAAYTCLAPFRNIGTRGPQYDAYRVLSQAEQDSCRSQLASVDSLFARRLAQWSATAGADRATLMQRLARLVSQWEDYARFTQSVAGIARDRHMAENVAWWRSRTNGTGTMLWAHNGHISRQSPWMGMHLAARYGSDYVNFAQTFSAGTFNAITQLPSGAFASLVTHGVAGSWPGSVEAMLDATTMTRAIFDTRAIPGGGTAASSLRRRLTMRFIGSVFAPSASPGIYQATLLLPEDFDVIIWFRDASASRLSLSAIVNDLQHMRIADH